jgi:glyoxylase-like metal-dependent hydrolase (beta-lactamase superfamily II)
MKTIVFLLSLGMFTFNPVNVDKTAEMDNTYTTDVFETSGGDLAIGFIGHATLMFKFKGLVIHVDPTMQEADYAAMPDADLILVTHHHGDHLDLTAINHIRKEDCPVVMTPACLEQLGSFEGAQRHRYCIPADEPPLYHDPGNGGGRCPGHPAGGPVPLPLREYGS